MSGGTATILGSGTSTGVPSLGTSYPPDYLADPRNHRMRASLLLRGPSGNVLVDCGPDVRTQLLRAGCMGLECVHLTHGHADHIMGMDDLRTFCLKKGGPMRIYADEPTQADIQRIFPYAFAPFPEGIMVPRFDIVTMPDSYQAGGLTIECVLVEHGPLAYCGVKVGGFAYLSDVSRIPAESAAQLMGLDTLVLDAVRIRPHPNHFHFDKAVEVALELGAKTTYLTHLCDDFDHAETEARLPAQIRLAYDGLDIPL
ncbi:MAG: MBL fold metallo-hydrolase [Armatimonadetes bacterium]|nr:MBL fold metallo-hydrolase [Armatimonadota bacterium]